MTSSNASRSPSAAVEVAQPSKPSENEAHVPGDRLDYDRGDLLGRLRKPSHRREVVVRSDERVLDGARRRPASRAARASRRRTPAADEEEVGVAVVAAANFTIFRRSVNARASRNALIVASVPAHEADELDGREGRVDERGQLGPSRLGAPKLVPRGVVLDRCDNLRVRVAEGQAEP